MPENILKMAENLFYRYEKQYGVISNYYGLLAYYALSKLAEAKNDEKLLKKCKDYLSLYPDKFEHPRYNFELYRAGGVGKAWLFLRGHMPEAEDVLREYAEITVNSPKSREGILCHPTFHERVWIDTVAFATPFMLYTGLAFNEQSYIDFAAKLCFDSYELFLDKTNGLLHQAKGFLDDPEKISEDYWSRGNGWGYTGLAELVEHLPAHSVHREKAIELFKNHTDSIIAHQSPRGLWKQILTEEHAWYESSGSALFLYGIGIGIRCGILKGDKYTNALKLGIEALGKYCICSNYKTLSSCPGCLCPGTGEEKGTVKAYLVEKQPRDDESHSFGCMILALTEAYKNGIKLLNPRVEEE